MIKRFLLVVLVAVMLPCIGGTQWTIGSRSFAPVVSSSGPTIVASTVKNLSTTGGTTPAIDTTGAKVIIVAVSCSVDCSRQVTDNKGNGSATIAGSIQGNGTYMGTLSVQYWLSPAVGAGHTFSYTAGYSSIAVIAVKGLVGTYDSNIVTFAPAASNTTCQTAALTPSTGTHFVVAALQHAYVSGTLSIDSSYAAPLYVNDVAGGPYGVGISYLVQSPNGFSTQPTWSTTGSPNIAGPSCAVASFS